MTDIPSRLAAALADRYRIVRELGAGGMATVYLAQDLKHDRKVAIKVLKPELAAVIGGERFLAEIRTTANLQHPHILPLFDSGESDRFLFYVMPYIEGDSLREMIDRERQLAVEDAVRIAKAIASALDYAHRHDVIHRDIKPENILIHDGNPVVADFGIALAVSAAGGGRMTETGLSLGTPHYMSPEQASADRDLSSRSDIYSLGCMLYEMLAGQPPHTGPSAQSVLVRILTETPRPLSEQRHSVPPHIGAAVSKAIEKLPADRFATADEFAKALDDRTFAYTAPMRAVTGAPTSAVDPSGGTRPEALVARRVLPWGVAAMAGIVAVWSVLSRPDPPPAPATRAQVTGLAMVNPAFGASQLAISPDGRWIVAPGLDQAGANVLYIRSADDVEWRLLPNTEGAYNPSFSPRGESVAFNLPGGGGGGGLSKVPVDGGPAIPLWDTGGEPHWASDGTIVFRAGNDVLRIPGSGGEAEVIFNSDDLSPVRPFLLPDGRGILFQTASTVTGDALASRVMYYHLGRAEFVEVAPSGVQPRYLSTGHVVYGHGGQALMAARFDPETGETGPASAIVPSMTVRAAGATYDVSGAGTLIYNGRPVSAGGASSRSFVEVDLEGNVSPLDLSPGELAVPRYSPDGGRIAYQIGGSNNPSSQIHIYDVATGASPQFTDGGGRYPVWSRSGEYLYFASMREGALSWDGFRRRADGSEPAEQVFRRQEEANPRSLAPGDSLLLIRENSRNGNGRDLRLMRIGPQLAPPDSAVVEAYLTAEWDEEMGVISPDGRYVAYQSDQSGEPRIYVQTFPVATGLRSVSPGAGGEPLWAPDGSRIYYRVEKTFYAVDVTYDPFSVGPPRELFRYPNYHSEESFLWPVQRWDIHPDGDRFILTEARGPDTESDDQSDGVSPIRELRDVYIVTSWFTELRERMGEGR